MIEIAETYLCLLDDLKLGEDVTLDEFSVRNICADELNGLIRPPTESGPDNQERVKIHADHPWAVLHGRKTAKDSWRAALLRIGLTYAHAGVLSWYPFTDMIRTLNLMKLSAGPIIPRHFYHRLVSGTEVTTHLEAVIAGEPYCVHLPNYDGTPMATGLEEYELNPQDKSCFSLLRQQLANCLSSADSPYLQIAIHYFENGDRRLVPQALAGSYNAIDPLMSYEACLEALLIREAERCVGKLLAQRIGKVMDTQTQGIRDFVRRLFWLRSKIAHGARSPEEIERLVVNHPNDGIEEASIPSGEYDRILLPSPFFPGFLANLREICRSCILHFVGRHADGAEREDILKELE